MATAQDIIDRATGILRVRGAGTSFSGNGKNSDVFKLLQDLIAEWVEADVINIPAPNATTDTLDISPGSVMALSFNLAVISASDLGKQPTPFVLKTAEESKDRLEADSTIDISVDMSDLSFSSHYNIYRDR